uniref:Peptidase M28 domain-containing protein n=1 Tax=Sander lucioperca TaxID=283035 RepID=A0A8C9ZG71_SANLU
HSLLSALCLSLSVLSQSVSLSLSLSLSLSISLSCLSLYLFSLSLYLCLSSLSLSLSSLSLSVSLSLSGGVVYANYGRPEDFTGESAGQGWLAERSGGGGALIYPDQPTCHRTPTFSLCVVQSQVHLGSGDPFTPGFPSFNHTQFPPIQSSGLPLIPVLPISATIATKFSPCSSQLAGPSCPPSWRGRLPYVRCVVGPEFSAGRRVKMAVHNVLTPVLLNNIFSSLTGRVEPDQYIILGAQRDSLGPGAVTSGVGTALLLELARTFSAMVKNGFSPRRSLLFVSWDAGDFGNVGATEWLEVRPIAEEEGINQPKDIQSSI